MANITDTANFRNTCANYRQFLELFADFIHDKAGYIWLLNKGLEVPGEVADQYYNFLQEMDELKAAVIEATEKINARRNYKLKVA